MAEKNNLTYDAWKEYLKSDKEMRSKWKSLIELGENVKKSLKEGLDALPSSEALRRKKFLTAKNIFDLINTAKEKPNFNWGQKIIWNAEDERHEYVIRCLDPSSDYIFRKIKQERGVTNMHGKSIDKYLKPVSDKIWALKETLKVSIQPEVNPSDLSYESLKTELPDEVDPDYPKASEGWSGPVDPKFEGTSSQLDDKVGDNEEESQDIKDKKTPTLRRNDKGQLVDEHNQLWFEFAE